MNASSGSLFLEVFKRADKIDGDSTNLQPMTFKATTPFTLKPSAASTVVCFSHSKALPVPVASSSEVYKSSLQQSVKRMLLGAPNNAEKKTLLLVSMSRWMCENLDLESQQTQLH